MKFTDGNFEEEVLKADQLAIVDFYADWCGPCKMLGPVIEQLADEYEGKVKNEYGRYVDCVTSSKNWLFIEEAPYKIEETFWVYGYNPKTDRKTYKFIIDNYMTYDKHDKYFFKEVIVYRNKVLIESNDNLNMIICKNHQDSVRLYNELYDYCKKEKYKNIVFGGDINQFSYSSELWFEKIQKLTNWSRRKINKNSTRD